MELPNKFKQKNAVWPSTLLALLFLGSLHACSSDSSNSVPNEAISEISTETNTPELSGTLLESTIIPVPPSLTAASNAVLFDYTMDAITGGTTMARAQLFEPAGQQPVDGYPLVVWAHGTTGIANACAPSLSFEDFSNDVAINSLLATGYAVLAPDYEGFGTSTIHSYYLRSSHAEAVLAAIPAAHDIENSELSNEWAVVGHSQGGHVALATARAEQNPAFPLQAVVALAPGTDLQPLSIRAFEAIDQALAEGAFFEAADRTFFLNLNGAFVAQAIPLVDPSFDPKTLFGDTVANLIDIALDEEICFDYANALDNALFEHLDAGGTLAEFGGLRRDWFTEPGIESLLQQEALGDEVQSAPLLVVQGDADRQVPVAATTDFVNTQLSLGTDVTYEMLPGGRHGDVARDDFTIAIDWLVQRFAP